MLVPRGIDGAFHRTLRGADHRAERRPERGRRRRSRRSTRAASLKNVLAKVEEAYEAANPGTTLTISTDSSAALETKIEQGAPADVFLSADVTNPQKLVDAGSPRARSCRSPATTSP